LKKIVFKYINGNISHEEKKLLKYWLMKPKNKETFREYIKIHALLNQKGNKVDVETAYKNILDKVQKPSKPLIKRLPLWTRYVGAACIIVLLVLFTGIQRFKRGAIDNDVTIQNNIVPGSNKAILQIEDGSDIELKGEEFVKLSNAVSNGKEIVYSTVKSNIKEVTYNTLTVPRGGQFMIVLSDQTKVWLNSESKLKYPVSFVDGEDRAVELIYGEAYFDVSPSTLHLGAKFKVLNQVQVIEVLGTEFNLKAYKGDNSIYTTLVEGSVHVISTNSKEVLLPNQQLRLNIKTNNLDMQFVDVYREISWKQGVFSFKKKPLRDIIEVLSRWYDMEVVFEKEPLKHILFTGTIKKELGIIDVLEIITEPEDIGYEIKDKKIIINQK